MKKRYINTLTSIAVILFIFAISVTGIIRAAKITPENILFENRSVYINNKSFLVEDTESGEIILKISPYDDYLYTDNQRHHILEKESQGTNSLIDMLNSLYLNLTHGSGSLLISVDKDKSGEKYIEYIAKGLYPRLNISRQVNEDSNYRQVGESYVICRSCVVTDSNNYIYFNYELLAENKQSLSDRLGFTLFSTHVDQELPISNTNGFVIVRNNLGRSLYSIPITEKDEVFFDEKYRLIEIKRGSNTSNIYKREINFLD